MTAAMELAAAVDEATVAAEAKFYGPTAYWADIYEKRERIHTLTSEGMSAAEVADVIGISSRNVQRHRGMSVPDNVIPLPPPADEVSDERAAELEVAADVVVDLAQRLQEENPCLVSDTLLRLSHWNLHELAIIALAAVNIHAPKSQLFDWVESLPAAQEDQQ